MEVLGLLLVAATLVGILFLMVGGMRPSRGSSGSRLAHYRSPEHSGALAATIVVSFALGTVFAGGSVSAAGTSGALLGATLAVTRITHVRVFDLLLTVLSLAGLATTLTSLAVGGACTDTRRSPNACFPTSCS